MSGDLGVTMELLDFYEQVLSRNNSQGVVIMEKTLAILAQYMDDDFLRNVNSGHCTWIYMMSFSFLMV